jgi:hypothetical protein
MEAAQKLPFERDETNEPKVTKTARTLKKSIVTIIGLS